MRFCSTIFAGLQWLLRNRKNRKRAAISIMAIALIGVTTAELTLDNRHLLWRSLVIDERAGFATGFKLRMIDFGPSSWCHDLVAESKLLVATSLEAVDGEGDCGWSQAYHLDKSGEVTLTGKSTYAMQCTLAAGSHIWIRSIDQHAQEILGSRLTRVHHVGTYSCRRMYNRANGKLSKHAFAKAWDVTGFELEDGRVISVLKHWKERGSKRDFLRAVHNSACDVFNVTLGPNYNAAHRDHFHVDMGGGAVCR